MSYPFTSQNLFTNLFHIRAVLSIISIPIQRKGVSNNLQVIHSLFDTPPGHYYAGPEKYQLLIFSGPAYFNRLYKLMPTSLLLPGG